MRTLLTYIGAFAALTVTMWAIAQLGEVIRAATPVGMHAPLSAAGALIVTGALLSLFVFQTPPFGIGVLAWRASMVAGIAAGLLLFCFYISGAECRPGGRSFHCTLVSFK
jgi:hypothetical protein